MKMNKFEYVLMTFDLGRQAYLKGIVKKLQQISHLGADKKILEIGCGNGIGTRLIQQVFKPREFIATEYDESLVEIARLKNKNLNVRVEAGDATQLRFQDNEFDAVIGLSVIHHIPNWKDCVDELLRITKPNGLLIIKELSIETFETPLGKLSRRLVEHPYDAMLKKKEFLDYLEQRGFKVITLLPHSMMYLLSDFFLVASKAPHGERTWIGFNDHKGM
jgi:ubiquinone/menaquinone biosynthesis C-methylase UbiE